MSGELISGAAGPCYTVDMVLYTIVLEDDDVLTSVCDDEMSLDDLLEYAESGGVAHYTLEVHTELDLVAICHALAIAASSEHELADGERAVLLWAEDDVGEAAQHLSKRLDDTAAAATTLCAVVEETAQIDVPADAHEIVDVLSEPDMRYQPDTDAHDALLAAAWVRRHLSALRAAERRGGSVIAF